MNKDLLLQKELIKEEYVNNDEIEKYMRGKYFTHMPRRKRKNVRHIIKKFTEGQEE